MVISFCLSVRSFVRLSPTRTDRALARLPSIPIVLATEIGRSDARSLKPVAAGAYQVGSATRAALTGSRALLDETLWGWSLSFVCINTGAHHRHHTVTKSLGLG